MDAHAGVLHNCFGAYFATVLSKTGRPQVFVLSNMSWPSLSSTCNRIWCCLKMLSFRFRYQCCDSASSLSVVVRGCVVNWLWKWGKENQEETINVDDREAGVAGIDQEPMVRLVPRISLAKLQIMVSWIKSFIKCKYPIYSHRVMNAMDWSYCFKQWLDLKWFCRNFGQ